MSATSDVPAGVPSVFQSSVPALAVVAAKYVVVPIRTKPVGFEALKLVAMSLTRKDVVCARAEGVWKRIIPVSIAATRTRIPRVEDLEFVTRPSACVGSPMVRRPTGSRHPRASLTSRMRYPRPAPGLRRGSVGSKGYAATPRARSPNRIGIGGRSDAFCEGATHSRRSPAKRMQADGLVANHRGVFAASFSAAATIGFAH